REARHRRPRGGAWLNGCMVNPPEAGIDLREKKPPSPVGSAFEHEPRPCVATDRHNGGRRASTGYTTSLSWLPTLACICYQPPRFRQATCLPCRRSGFRRERLGSHGNPPPNQ